MAPAIAAPMTRTGAATQSRVVIEKLLVSLERATGETLQHSLSDLRQRLADHHYVADQGLAISLFLALRLGRPLFLEGEAGVGKTSLAAAVAAALDADLIRLQ